MQLLAWPIMGLVFVFFMNACETHQGSKYGLIADAGTTEESRSDGKVVKMAEAELACEGPSTVCEVL